MLHEVIHSIFNTNFNKSGHFVIEYISTKEQVADILTKPLPKETFEKLRESCAVTRQPAITA